MPMYDYLCCNGHVEETFRNVSEIDNPRACNECGGLSLVTITKSNPLTAFRENNGQWIWNMGPDPVYITSHSQHKAEMKKRGLQFATPKRGMPGAW